MDNRELDAKVAERVMGNRPAWGLEVLPYSTDISEAYQMEERIAELGLIEEYCIHLNKISNANLDELRYMIHRPPLCWQLLHATPEDRCLAALKAVDAGR